MQWLFETGFAFLQNELTLSTGLAIIVFTIGLRLLLLPISFSAMLHGVKQRQQLKQLQPQIEAIKTRYQSNPTLMSTKLMQFYKENHISFVNKNNLINMAVQGVTGFGIFQFLSNSAFSGRFLWMTDLAKSDLFLSIVVAAVTGLSMYLMPSATESVNYLMIVIVSAVCLISLLNFSSAIGVYWGTSTLMGTIQSLVANSRISTHNG